jgi:murein L,D-transpeptidase YcbB/YkuD
MSVTVNCPWCNWSDTWKVEDGSAQESLLAHKHKCQNRPRELEGIRADMKQNIESNNYGSDATDAIVGELLRMTDVPNGSDTAQRDQSGNEGAKGASTFIAERAKFTQALAELERAATCIGYAKNQNERENHQKNLKAAKADLIRAHNAQLEEVERDLYLRIGAVERALETVRKELEEEQLSHCHTRYTLEDITEQLEAAIQREQAGEIDA